MADEKLTRKDIRDELLKNLKPIVKRMQEREAAGMVALSKGEGGKGVCSECGKLVAKAGGALASHGACKGRTGIGMKKDDGTGMSPGAPMEMNEEGEGASMMKCGSCGEMHKNADCYGAPEMVKEEKGDVKNEPAPAKCTTPGCTHQGEHIGLVGETHHYLCPGCGASYSTSAATEPHGDDPMSKEEVAAVESAPEKDAKGSKLPDGAGKEIDAEGSGSDPKKGKELAKGYEGFKKLKGELAHKSGVRDPGAVAAAIGEKKYGKEAFEHAAHAGKKMGKADTWNPATGAADEAHVRGSVAAKTPAPAAAPKKSPAGLRGTPENKIKPMAKAALPAGKPGGQTVMSRFRLGQGGTPAGAKPPLPGLTPTVKPMGMRPAGKTVMQHLGHAPTPAAQANKEIGGFKSLAGSATHLAPMGKAALPAAPKMPSAPKMPGTAAPGAAAPKNPMGSAK